MSDSNDTGSLYDLHDRLIIAHAVFASIAALFLVPIALIIARYMRHRPVWYKIHFALNGMAALFIVIVFALGTSAAGPEQFTGKHSDTHHRIGLATFILVIIQAIVGFGSHYTKPGFPRGLPAPGKHWIRYVHAFTGICVAGTLYAAVYSGFHEWTNASDNGSATPTGVRAVFWVLFAIAVVAYVAGFWLKLGIVNAKTAAVEEKGDANTE